MHEKKSKIIAVSGVDRYTIEGFGLMRTCARKSGPDCSSVLAAVSASAGAKWDWTSSAWLAPVASEFYGVSVLVS